MGEGTFVVCNLVAGLLGACGKWKHWKARSEVGFLFFARCLGRVLPLRSDGLAARLCGKWAVGSGQTVDEADDSEAE